MIYEEGKKKKRGGEGTTCKEETTGPRETLPSRKWKNEVKENILTEGDFVLTHNG